jgi:hypothetical protein
VFDLSPLVSLEPARGVLGGWLMGRIGLGRGCEEACLLCQGSRHGSTTYDNIVYKSSLTLCNVHLTMSSAESLRSCSESQSFNLSTWPLHPQHEQRRPLATTGDYGPIYVDNPIKCRHDKRPYAVSSYPSMRRPWQNSSVQHSTYNPPSGQF